MISNLLICSVIMTVSMVQGYQRDIDIDNKMGEVDVIEAEIDYGMGELTISEGESNRAVTGRVQYIPDEVSIVEKYTEKKNIGHYKFETHWPDNNNDDEDNNLETELNFSNRIPLKFNIDCGLSEVDLDLAGLKIKELIMDNGLGSVDIEFGQRSNKVRCDRLDIDTGLGEVEIENLANANADFMEFECGLGSLELGFQGDLDDDITVDLSVGMGSVDIYIPEGTNVIVEYDQSFFSDVDLRGFEQISGDTYRSINFREKKPIISIQASIGMGSIDVHWID